MYEYISIRNQACPNNHCRFYGKTLGGNVITHSQKARRMKCKTCGKTWSAYMHDIRYRLHSDPQKIEKAIEMLKAEISIRQAAREINVSPSTVQRWKARVKNNLFLNSYLYGV